MYVANMCPRLSLPAFGMAGSPSRSASSSTVCDISHAAREDMYGSSGSRYVVVAASSASNSVLPPSGFIVRSSAK